MEPNGLVIWIVVGLIAGFFASQVVPSKYGIVGDTVIGMIGAVLGGLLFGQAGYGSGGFTAWSILVAFIGAVILLLLLREINKGRQ